ncbi:MAG: hypothetical protein GX259_03925 [Bacteroidales bacterium]|jgi:outer membrane murein-binding lipoprotein Lpp|nr:hypothetical protein [Bacteroidales bacterium]
MKSIAKIFVLVLVSSSLMLIGCKKDKKDDIPKETYNCVLTAKVDGLVFSVSTPLAQMSMGVLQIGGTNAAGSMQVVMAYDVTAGTYTITGDTDEAVYWKSGENSFWPMTGSLVVSKHDVSNNIVEGTFTASLREMSTDVYAEITEGVFKMKYTE